MNHSINSIMLSLLRIARVTSRSGVLSHARRFVKTDINVDADSKTKEIQADIDDLSTKINQVNEKINTIIEAENTSYRKKLDTVKAEFTRIDKHIENMSALEKHNYMEQELPNLMRDVKYMVRQLDNIYVAENFYRNLAFIKYHSNSLQKGWSENNSRLAAAIANIPYKNIIVHYDYKMYKLYVLKYGFIAGGIGLIGYYLFKYPLAWIWS